MKRRRIFLLLALLVVAAGVVLFWLRGPKEPVYEGKGITFWINEVFAARGPEALHTARKAVLATSADSRRFLMSEFTRRDPKWLASFKVWLNNQFGRAVPGQSTKVQRMETVSLGLRLLGPENAPSLPTLAEYLRDEQRGRLAVVAMSGAGDAAIPYLADGIASTNPVVVENVRCGVMELAHETDSILPTLYQWLQHTNSAIRNVAVIALIASNSQTNWIVPALTTALSDPDFRVQWNAASALRYRGPAAKPAIPALLRLMTNSSHDVARIASNAVFRIDPTALPQSTP